jgi:mannose-6-phosphate isomerase-like protein (cupin superfamily)
MPVIDTTSLAGAELEGAEYGATISLILNDSEPGHGPRLHRHPYDETWVIEQGNLTFQMGEEEVAVDAGDIVIVPPHTPHKFTNTGPGRARLVCIHANPNFVTEWLE